MTKTKNIDLRSDREYIERILKVLSFLDMQTLAADFLCDREGVHGMRHWVRVAMNGLMLSDHEGGSDAVAVLFAFFHDIGRHREYADPDHGARGAARFLESDFTRRLSSEQVYIVTEACEWHTHGKRSEIPQIGLLWDADRLDLRRVLVTPEDPYLTTETARDPRVKLWADREGISFLNRDPLSEMFDGALV